MIDHRAAYSAAMYGLITVVLFLAPVFIYTKEYNEQQNQKGKVGGGDAIGMVSQALGIHIALVFLFAVILSMLDIVMAANPAMKTSKALETFYMLSAGADASTLMDRMIHADWGAAAAPANGAPIGKATMEGFNLFMKGTALGLTIIFLAIPVIIVTLTFVYAFGANEQQQESVVARVISAFGFFVAAVLLLYIHAELASALVVMISGSDFSFFEVMQGVWKKMLT